jgi:hypothetical protein
MARCAPSDTGCDVSTRRALCVGINDYAYEGSDLKGCVADAHDWARLLTESFGFPRDDVRLLVNAEATKRRILDGLDWLLSDARSGDCRVFTNASHGTYVIDESGDEEGYDEALCPFDCAENLILDDELRVRFAGVPDDVSLVVISDSCHSGTLTRAAAAQTPDDRRVRFLNPQLRGGRVLARPWLSAARHVRPQAEGGMKEILLSGCRATEYSYDALIDGAHHGAMTYYAIKAIRDADCRITYDELHRRLSKSLTAAAFPQHPQLEGTGRNKSRQVFGSVP